MAPRWVTQIFWTLAASGLVYVVGILSLVHPVVQRNATYVHNLNPTFFQDLSNVEAFGFLKHQVQPFTIQSTDNVTLYAWHILPVHLYRKHKAELHAAGPPRVQAWDSAAESTAVRLLLENPQANVVVSFHGNAGHLASSYRSATYQQILSLSTDERPVHVVTFDYRGFGLSTGSPSERGVIDDGLAIVSALCGTNPEQAVSLLPSQIVLLGQSMGTFISTATLYDWTVKLQRAPFKALVLIAGFSSLPRLLDSYSIGGFAPPVLSPLVQYPRVKAWLRNKIVDQWDTASRLVEMVTQPNLSLDLTMMHAADDWEIPYREGHHNWELIAAVVNGTGQMVKSHDEVSHPDFVNTWTSDDGRKKVRFEKVRHGGHNKIPTSEHLKDVLHDIIDRPVDS